MRREIKFRMVDVDDDGNKKVTTNSYTLYELLNYRDCEWQFKDGGTLSGNDALFFGIHSLVECTGLRDKNGRDICEGDILDDPRLRNTDSFRIYEVKHGEVSQPWDDGGYYGFGLRLFCSDEIDAFLETELVKSLEIIGNIYENPELLKYPELIE